MPDPGENWGGTSENKASGVVTKRVVEGGATDEVPGEAAETDAGEAAAGGAEPQPRQNHPHPLRHRPHIRPVRARR